MLIQQIEKINELTLAISKLLDEDKLEEVEQLLNDRQAAMDEIDRKKAVFPDYQYSLDEKKLLQEIVVNDDFCSKKLVKSFNETRASLGQIRKTIRASEGYGSSARQIYGAFIDDKS